jgi:hypothetical protein
VKFECRKAPSRSAINRLVNKFEATGGMIDNKKGVVGKKSVRTPGNIHHVQQALTQSRKICKTFFSTTQLGSIITIQDNLRRCETVSIQNSNAASPS